MTMFVQVKDGAVTNRTAFAGDVPADWPERETWIAHADAQIGWWMQDGALAPPVAIDMPAAPTLDEIRAGLVTLVNAAAEAERHKYLTPGAGQALTYEAKRTETARHKADPELELNAVNYPWAAARAAAFNLAIADVLTEWTARADQWAAIGQGIEEARELANAAIAAAADEAAARGVLAALTFPKPG